MKTKLFFLSISLISLLAIPLNSNANNGSQQHSITGTYKTDFQDMTLQINGNRVTGTYKYRNGRVEGTLNGNTLTGTWTQSNGKGRLEFIFNSNFSGFTGKWSYSNQPLSGKWNGTKIGGASSGYSSSVNSSTTPTNSHSIEGTYSTDFQEMTLQINGNRVTGSYKYRNGRVEGTLKGNTLTGTWTQSNGKGRLVFVFNNDFSAFTGKWGNNEKVPTSKWNGTKIKSASPVSSVPSSSGELSSAPASSNLPVDIAGSWSSGGSRNQIGRVHIWQNGDDFTVIAAWPDAATGKWKSYKGDGRLSGRQMNFKVYPSATNGSSSDEGYVYHYTISPDNTEISGYYTRNGQRTVNTNVLYKRVQ